MGNRSDSDGGPPSAAPSRPWPGSTNLEVAFPGDRSPSRWQRLTGPRGRDVTIVVLSAIVTLAGVIQQLIRKEPSTAVFTGLFSAVGTVVLWWRRSNPVGVTAAGVVVVLLSGNPVPVCFALMRLAIEGRNRLLVVATVVVALALASPQVGTDGGFGFGSLIGAAVAAVFFAMWGGYVGARRDLISSLQDRAERAEAERELRSDQARLAERSRIAREMHDVLAHKVSLIALQAGALEVNADAAPAVIESSAALIRTTARQAMEDLREVLGVLRDAEVDEVVPQPDLADLHRLLESARAAGVAVSARIAVDGEVPAQVGRTVYRVVQESLTNAAKHARGAAVDVDVRRAGDAVIVTVDNAAAVSAEGLLPGSGFGLIGLRERVGVLGGTLQAGRTAAGGWSVTAGVPLAPTQPDSGSVPVESARAALPRR